MKTNLNNTAIGLAMAMFLAATSHAAISGINSPANSNATIRFGDGNSFAGANNGGTYSPPVANPWNGTLYSTPAYTDATTLDTAQGSISASFAGNTYALNIPLANLAQAPANTGSAILQFLCVVEFQMDAAGLPFMPTLFPVFVINGTVQTGGFAGLTGNIDYISAFFAGSVEMVNYSYSNFAPGPFNATISGVPVNNNTPALPAFDTLTLIANFTFTVDPASINATTVPEPSAGLLTALSALPLLLRRRRVAQG